LRIPSKRFPLLLLIMVASLSVAGCGGGGGGELTDSPTGTGTPTSKILRWSPPQNFADQTPLDPARDLSHYEIHISNTGNFSQPDVTEATVSASDPATGQIVTSFNLANLANYLAPNVTYYVSMQSVTNTGVKSDFSPAASFSL
jgi:hypothetical protein